MREFIKSAGGFVLDGFLLWAKLSAAAAVVLVAVLVFLFFAELWQDRRR